MIVNPDLPDNLAAFHDSGPPHPLDYQAADDVDRNFLHLQKIDRSTYVNAFIVVAILFSGVFFISLTLIFGLLLLMFMMR